MNYKFILIGFLLFQLFACQNTRQKELIEVDYGMTYPENFLVDESGTNGTSVVLKIPHENPKTDFFSNINLMVQDLEGMNLDLDDFVELTKQQMEGVGHIIHNKRMKVGKSEFQSLLFEGNINGFDLKFLQYDFVKNNKAYVLTYTAKKDEFDTHFMEAKRVMDSFYLN